MWSFLPCNNYICTKNEIHWAIFLSAPVRGRLMDAQRFSSLLYKYKSPHLCAARDNMQRGLWKWENLFRSAGARHCAWFSPVYPLIWHYVVISPTTPPPRRVISDDLLSAASSSGAALRHRQPSVAAENIRLSCSGTEWNPSARRSYTLHLSFFYPGKNSSFHITLYMVEKREKERCARKWGKTVSCTFCGAHRFFYPRALWEHFSFPFII